MACCSFKQKHIVHVAAQLLAHCLALFSWGEYGTWFNESWEPLEGDFLLLNLAFTHMHASWCHQPNPGAWFLCPQERRHASASRIITAWSVQSRNLWQECWVLANAWTYSICVSASWCLLVWMDCTETHTETLLRAGDVDTELLYVWRAHRNQFTVAWKYFQQGK